MLQHCDNVVTMLPQCCLNIGLNIVFVDTIKRTSNVVWISRQRCVNILQNFVYWQKSQHCQNIDTQHSPRSANIETTFRQCCMNIVAMSLPMLVTNIGTMFRQCCVNVVATSLTTLGTDIETTLSQRCVNVVSTLVPCIVLGWCRSRMTVTFKFECSTHLQHQHVSLHWYNLICKHLWIILPMMAVELMGKWWIFKKFPQ